MDAANDKVQVRAELAFDKLAFDIDMAKRQLYTLIMSQRTLADHVWVVMARDLFNRVRPIPLATFSTSGGLSPDETVGVVRFVTEEVRKEAQRRAEQSGRDARDADAQPLASGCLRRALRRRAR